MISKRTYLKALAIVEAYHAQIGLSVIPARQPIETEIKRGGFVTCITVWKQSATNLTIGNHYNVIRVKHFEYGRESRFEIITDSGKRRWYDVENSQFEIKQ